MSQEREVELDEVVGSIMSTYDDKCYGAVLACIKRSMLILRRRLCSSSGGVLYVDQVRNSKCALFKLVECLHRHDFLYHSSCLTHYGSHFSKLMLNFVSRA